MMLGVIGGAGVAATNRFCTLLEEAFTRNGAFRDAHHPEMIIHQATQSPSRSMFLEGRGPDFRPSYVHSGQQLKACGAEMLIMVCNTAHYAKDEIAEAVGLPVFDVIATALTAARETGGQSVGLLASDGIIRTGLYGQVMEQVFPDGQLILPEAEVQADVTRAIVNTKSAKRFLGEDDPEHPAHLFDSVCGHLIDKGADVIVSGCTDLSVQCHRTSYRDVPIVDFVQTSVDAIYTLLTNTAET